MLRVNVRALKEDPGYVRGVFFPFVRQPNGRVPVPSLTLTEKKMDAC